MHLRTQKRVDKYAGGLAIALLRPVTILLGVLLRRDHRLAVRDSIVWVKMVGGGSVLLAMPMLLGLRRAFPHAKMVLVTTPAVRPFAELTGAFDEYRVIDDRGALPLMRSALVAWFRTVRADCIVDLEVYSRLTTVFATATMARNRVAFWLEDIFWRRGLASHLVFFNRASGSYLFYDRIADLFDAPIASREECRTALLLACGLAEPLAVDPGRVCIGFACSELGRERMLTPGQWVVAFREHLRPGHRSAVFLGGAADRAYADRIIDEVRRHFPGVALQNACGELSLRQSAALLLQSAEFWGIDSGLLHCARIAGLRCVSYWGPTAPTTRLREDGAIHEDVHYRKIACSPCVHVTEEPPCRGDNRCIQGLFDPGRAPTDWTPVDYPKLRRAGG